MHRVIVGEANGGDVSVVGTASAYTRPTVVVGAGGHRGPARGVVDGGGDATFVVDAAVGAGWWPVGDAFTCEELRNYLQQY
jgi:hypothetical protein